MKLNADHIRSFAHYPELRFDILNGRIQVTQRNEGQAQTGRSPDIRISDNDGTVLSLTSNGTVNAREM